MHAAGVRPCNLPCEVRADVVAADRVAAACVEQDAGPLRAGEAVDDETADRAVAGGDRQPVGAIDPTREARVGTVELDHGPIPAAREVGLGGSVDRHRLGDRGELRAGPDRVRGGAGNVECDRVCAGYRVRPIDRLTEAAVGRIADAVVVVVGCVDGYSGDRWGARDPPVRKVIVTDDVEEVGLVPSLGVNRVQVAEGIRDPCAEHDLRAVRREGRMRCTGGAHPGGILPVRAHHPKVDVARDI